MAVEKMQFSMPMAGDEGLPFTVTQGQGEKEAISRAKAEEEKEAAILKAKAETEAEKEEGIIEAYYNLEEEEKLSDGDDDSDVDQDAFMASMEAQWNTFIKDELARFPAIWYREYAIGEYSVDDSSDSDDEQEYYYYLRKLEASHGVEGCDIAALVI